MTIFFMCLCVYVSNKVEVNVCKTDNNSVGSLEDESGGFSFF